MHKILDEVSIREMKWFT